MLLKKARIFHKLKRHITFIDKVRGNIFFSSSFQLNLEENSVQKKNYS